MTATTPRWKDTSLPFEERADDLLAAMSLDEKLSQMTHDCAAIPRLGIPDHNWWNEVLHGVGRGGVATVFPVAIGMAATFDTTLLNTVATAISDEARARHHALAAKGDRGMYKGLTAWTPNINIFRDPRWGRGHETYGECPFLTGRMGTTFVKAIQGDHPRYLKLVATPKHFAVHSGPEKDRHTFDARVTVKDLRETYLPHFRETFIEGHAYSVMSAYNRTNGEACSASKTLLQDILRGEWGFDGCVVSDCWAIKDIFDTHKMVETAEEAAAMSIKAGCDIDCGCTYKHLRSAYSQKLVSEADIDRALRRTLLARFKLGMFDPEEMVPYAQIPYEVTDSPAHRALARHAARKTVVLLKNEGSLLPLPRNLDCIAVIGPNAYDHETLLGNYHGTSSQTVTPLDGIRAAVGPETKVLYALGCEMIPQESVALGRKDRFFAEAVLAAERADVVIMCLGLNCLIEGEQGDASNSDAAGDRVHLNLHGIQDQLLQAIASTGKPIVVVLISGSAVAVNWADENVPAIVQAWYGGEEAGNGLADVLFGDYNPGGRLPLTFYRGVEQIPPIEEYAMEGRTYRYFRKEPLYPFGWGLSYTTFGYFNVEVSNFAPAVGEEIHVSVEVMNTGDYAGEEVVQLYVAHENPSVKAPIRDLRGFQRVALEPGESKRVGFTLNPRHLSLVGEDGKRFQEAGKVLVTVGGCQPDERSRALGGLWLEEVIEVKGNRISIPER